LPVAASISPTRSTRHRAVGLSGRATT
jgi:hypothetical protein